MSPISLHHFRQNTRQLNIWLALLCVCWLGLSQLSAGHSLDHAIQADNQCALCLSSSHFEHGLPANQNIINVHQPIPLLFTLVAIDLNSRSIHFNGNRDPPSLV